MGRRAATWAGAALAAVLAGQCVQAGQGKQREQLLQQLLATLKDADSAKFQRVELRRSDSPPAVSLCGAVNAKNSYGGYTGLGRFVSTSTGVVAFERDEQNFQPIWETWCSLPAR